MKNLFLTALCLCVASVFIYNLKGPKGLSSLNTNESEVVKYNKLFPLHAQVCAQSVNGKRERPVIFLKGACIDKNNSKLNHCSYMNDSYEDGVGVRFEELEKKMVMSFAQGRTSFFKAKDSMTEYFCVKTPLPKVGLNSLVAKLNEYQKRPGETNASDVVELVLTKAGFPHLEVEKLGLVPSLVSVLNAEREFGNFVSAFSRPKMREILTKGEDSIFPLHGTLIEHIGTSKKFSFKEIDEKASNLERNLEYYSNQYDAIWKHRKDLNESFHESVKSRGIASDLGKKRNAKTFTLFYKNYYKQILLKKRDADLKLNQLRLLKKF